MTFYEEAGYTSLLAWCEAEQISFQGEKFQGRDIRYFLVPASGPCHCEETMSEDYFVGAKASDSSLPKTLVRVFIKENQLNEWWSPPSWVRDVGAARNMVRDFYDKHGNLGGNPPE